MKFLILGCNGMAGHMLSVCLQERGHDVTGFARRDAGLVRTIRGDAHDLDGLRDAVLSGGYDEAVNCIGILNQYAENGHAEAVFINSYIPHFLAEITKDTDTRIIHISTDCVFSGRKGGYTEDSRADAETFYGRSKALGELDDSKNLTFRQSIIGPDINPDGIGLLNWFMKQEGPVNGWTGAIWSGITTLELARAVENAAASRHNSKTQQQDTTARHNSKTQQQDTTARHNSKTQQQDTTARHNSKTQQQDTTANNTLTGGLYSIVPDESITKYELLRLFSRYMRGGRTEVRPVQGIIADKSLKTVHPFAGIKIPGYEGMVSELAEWMSHHRKLYSHYYKRRR